MANEHTVSSEGLNCVTGCLGMHFVKGEKKANSFLPSQEGELAHQRAKKERGLCGQEQWQRGGCRRSSIFPIQLGWLSFNVDL